MGGARILKPRATIYPFGKDDVQLFRYAHLIEAFEPVCPVAPPGWGLFGMDISEVDGGLPRGCKITTDLENALDQTELLVLTSFKPFHGERGNFNEALRLATLKNKEVIILELPDSVDQESFTILQNKRLLKKIFPEPIDINFNSTCRKKLDVPVMIVFGEGPSTDKFEVQLALRDQMLHRKYKVTQVGSRSYAELFGFHSFPAFMQSLDLSETEKIIRFNQCLKQWETREKPELIIIGVPQGIVPITEELHNDYGMTLLEVAAASEPDLLVNTLYHLDYLPEFYEYKEMYSFGKLGCETSCFVLSRTWLDVVATKNDKILTTLKLRKTVKSMEKLVDSRTGNVLPLISLQQPDASEAIADIVIAKLKSFEPLNFV